ncbi:MAG: EAL domain-containing protein, partial [Paracoccaceae bacterium]
LKIKPEILKIDRQFIEPIVREENSRALVSSIVGIGKSLGIDVVAEGVESEDHANLVRAMGCDYLQGYYFGKPMPASDLLDKLRKNGGQFWSPPQKVSGGKPA